jgi:hypothetical protein
MTPYLYLPSKYKFNSSPDVSIFFFDVRRTVPYFYVLLNGVFHKLASRLGFIFWRTMVAGGFGPYHRLWRGATPTKRTGVIHTPRAMPPALCLGSIHGGGEW